LQRPLKVRCKTHAIGQVGQGVVACHVLDPEFGLTLCGDVLVGHDPPSGRDRGVDEMDRAPVEITVISRNHFAAAHFLDQVVAIGFRFFVKNAVRTAQAEHILKCHAQTDLVLAPFEYLQIAAIGEPQPPRAVEHHHALGQAVQNLVKEAGVSVRGPPPAGEGGCRASPFSFLQLTHPSAPAFRHRAEDHGELE